MRTENYYKKKLKDTLNDDHLADLRKSGLSFKTILNHKIRSVGSMEARKLLNRERSVGSGYVIPYPGGSNGSFNGELNFKVDKPLNDGKRKYLRPNGSKNQLYIPISVWGVLDNIRIDLIITEGEKKALKATQEGFPTISISGVWNWSTDKQLIKSFKLIKLKGRTVYICFDGDKKLKEGVALAEKRLADELCERGAKVKIVNLPKKMKLDDYLVKYGKERFKNRLQKASTHNYLQKIVVYKDDYKSITDLAWGVIQEANRKEPFMFDSSNIPCRIEKDYGTGKVRIKHLEGAHLRHYLIRLANWMFIKSEEK